MCLTPLFEAIFEARIGMFIFVLVPVCDVMHAVDWDWGSMPEGWRLPRGCLVGDRHGGPGHSVGVRQSREMGDIWRMIWQGRIPERAACGRVEERRCADDRAGTVLRWDGKRE
jgi:hypothetical protein